MEFIQTKDDDVFSFKKPVDIASFIVNRLIDRLDTTFSIKRISKISGITLYRKNKTMFDKLFSIQEKYGIDICGYVSYYMREHKNMSGSEIASLLDISNIVRYANDLMIQKKHEKILENFNKSVSYIIKEANRRNCRSISDCIKELILENKIAVLYLSGKLSSHYLAGIKNLKKLVRKMDSISVDTLTEVSEQQEKLLSDLRDAFMRLKNISVISSIAYTEQQRTI